MLTRNPIPRHRRNENRPPVPKRRAPVPKHNRPRPPRPRRAKRYSKLCTRCGEEVAYDAACHFTRLKTDLCRVCRTYLMGRANAKLTDEEARYVYEQVAGGRSRASLAREFGVCTRVPENLVAGRSYRHLELEPLA